MIISAFPVGAFYKKSAIKLNSVTYFNDNITNISYQTIELNHGESSRILM